MNRKNRQEYEMDLYNSLISEDGMIHVDYPTTVRKGEVCAPAGEIFEFEDGDTENIACFAVTKSGEVILAAVDGEEAELAQTEGFKPKVFELYFGETTYDELPIEIVNEMQSDGIEFNDETGGFYFEDQDHADIWGYPKGVADSRRVKDSKKIKDSVESAMVLAYKFEGVDGRIKDEIESEFNIDDPQIEAFDQFVRKVCGIAQRLDCQAGEGPDSIGKQNGLYQAFITSEDTKNDVYCTISYAFVNDAVSTKEVDTLWRGYFNEYGV